MRYNCGLANLDKWKAPLDKLQLCFISAWTVDFTNAKAISVLQPTSSFIFSFERRGLSEIQRSTLYVYRFLLLHLVLLPFLAIQIIQLTGMLSKLKMTC